MDFLLFDGRPSPDGVDVPWLSPFLKGRIRYIRSEDLPSAKAIRFAQARPRAFLRRFSTNREAGWTSRSRRTRSAISSCSTLRKHFSRRSEERRVGIEL